jgi:hypothetical protein
MEPIFQKPDEREINVSQNSVQNVEKIVSKSVNYVHTQQIVVQNVQAQLNEELQEKPCSGVECDVLNGSTLEVPSVHSYWQLDWMQDGDSLLHLLPFSSVGEWELPQKVKQEKKRKYKEEEMYPETLNQEVHPELYSVSKESSRSPLLPNQSPEVHVTFEGSNMAYRTKQSSVWNHPKPEQPKKKEYPPTFIKKYLSFYSDWIDQ